MILCDLNLRGALCVFPCAHASTRCRLRWTTLPFANMLLCFGQTRMCKHWLASMGTQCPHGVRCTYAHGPTELNAFKKLAAASGADDPAVAATGGSGNNHEDEYSEPVEEAVASKDHPVRYRVNDPPHLREPWKGGPAPRADPLAGPARPVLRKPTTSAGQHRAALDAPSVGPTAAAGGRHAAAPAVAVPVSGDPAVALREPHQASPRELSWYPDSYTGAAPAAAPRGGLGGQEDRGIPEGAVGRYARDGWHRSPADVPAAVYPEAPPGYQVEYRLRSAGGAPADLPDSAPSMGYRFAASGPPQRPVRMAGDFPDHVGDYYPVMTRWVPVHDPRYVAAGPPPVEYAMYPVEASHPRAGPYDSSRFPSRNALPYDAADPGAGPYRSPMRPQYVEVVGYRYEDDVASRGVERVVYPGAPAMGEGPHGPYFRAAPTPVGVNDRVAAVETVMRRLEPEPVYQPPPGVLGHSGLYVSPAWAAGRNCDCARV